MKCDLRRDRKKDSRVPMTDLTTFTPRPIPGRSPLSGRYVDLVPVDWPLHGEELFKATCGAEDADLWTYISFGPFAEAKHLSGTMFMAAKAKDWETLAICAPGTGRVLGTASYMRVRPGAGSVEAGCIVYGRALQKTRAGTEAMYLMARHAFDDLGYRRYEWKCDNLNAASKKAALRYGFTYEGLFRQDLVVKGKNRDTAWFSILDTEWPAVKSVFEAWLDPNNFDAQGQQKQSLSDFRNA